MTTPSQASAFRASHRSLSISRRIALGFASVLFLVAVISGVAIFSSWETRVSVQNYTAEAESALRMGQLKQQFLALNGDVSRYASDGSAEMAKHVAQSGEALLDAVIQAKTTVPPAGIRQGMLQEIAETLKGYLTNIATMTDRHSQLEALITKSLDVDGANTVDNLNLLASEMGSLNNADGVTYTRSARDQFLQARLSAYMYLGRFQPALATQTTDALAQVAQPLDLVAYSLDALPASKSGDARQFLKDAQASQASFARSFSQAQVLLTDLRTILDGPMKEQANSLTATFDKLTQAALDKELAIKDALETRMITSDTVVVLVSVLGLAGGAVVAWLIGRGLSRPVMAMTAAMQSLADGVLDIFVPGRERGDELGQMAKALAVFQQHARENKRLEEQQQQMAIQAEQDRKDLMVSLADDFQESVGQIVAMVSQSSQTMQGLAQQMTSSASSAQERAGRVAVASEEASSNVQTVATAAEELAASIAEIGRQVRESSEIAHAAVEEAQRTDAMVQGLADSAQKIGEVVALITSVADQTNLLALNATIEAARAGEAGKGFAVVANEVKTLANQTARATEEISLQIRAVQDATEQSVGAIRHIGQTISHIDTIAANIASAIEQQGVATREITHNVHQAALGTQGVSENITAVNSAAEQTGSASLQVLSAAEQVQAEAQRLTREMNSFLVQIRAG